MSRIHSVLLVLMFNAVPFFPTDVVCDLGSPPLWDRKDIRILKIF